MFTRRHTDARNPVRLGWSKIEFFSSDPTRAYSGAARSVRCAARIRTVKFQRVSLMKSQRLGAVPCQKYPDRAVDHLCDALRRRARRCLEDEGKKQRCLADLHELRGGELAVDDGQLVGPHPRIEVGGEMVDGFLQHVL